MPVTIGGRGFASGGSYDDFADRLAAGWGFSMTTLSQEFSLDDMLSANGEVEVIAILKSSGAVIFASERKLPQAGAGDRVLTFRQRESAVAEAP